VHRQVVPDQAAGQPSSRELGFSGGDSSQYNQVIQRFSTYLATSVGASRSPE
jgi:hypothetical protein